MSHPRYNDNLTFFTKRHLLYHRINHQESIELQKLQNSGKSHLEKVKFARLCLSKIDLIESLPEVEEQHISSQIYMGTNKLKRNYKKQT